MIILPAVDIMGGQCVRLFQGDYKSAHEVAKSPLDAARQFQAQGAVWLHCVDLDAAKAGEPKNFQTVRQIIEETKLSVEIGGGIRDMKTAARYLEAGAGRVVLGSAAARDPRFVEEAVRSFGDGIAVGIDARDGRVAVSGWTQESELDYIELAKRMEGIGVTTIIFTDIAKDGMEQGPNLGQLAALQEAVGCRIIASGGVTTLKDIEALRALSLYGAICGKAVYTGKLPLEKAILAGEGRPC